MCWTGHGSRFCVLYRLAVLVVAASTLIVSWYSVGAYISRSGSTSQVGVPWLIAMASIASIGAVGAVWDVFHTSRGVMLAGLVLIAVDPVGFAYAPSIAALLLASIGMAGLYARRRSVGRENRR